jgi:dihydroneopterin aldolase
MQPSNEHMGELYCLENLAIDTTIGLYSHERHIKQTLLFSLTARVDTRVLSSTELDKLFKNIINEYCLKFKPLLLERMAYELLLLLQEIDGLTSCSLTIEKPSAMKEAQASYVRIIGAKGPPLP